jgi:hypothetical protein
MIPRPLFCAVLAILCAQLHAQSTGLFVNSSNNVGIGTTSPQTKLDIQGDGSDSQDLLRITRGGGNQSRVQIGHCYIQRYDGTGAPNALYINANGGNVGIGTMSPGYPLDVSGGIHSTVVGGSNLFLSKANGSSIAFDNGSGSTKALIEANNGPGLEFWTNTGANTGIVERMLINNSGLDLNGTARIEGGISLPNNTWISEDDTSGHSHLILGVYGNNFIGIGDITNAFGSGVLFAANQEFLWYVNGNLAAALDPSGNLHANSFIASSGQQYADFVFKPDYKLPPLSDVEAAIKKDGHLPGIPSEAEAKAHGIDLASMQVKLLQKIEELTLHQIEQEKRLNEQSADIEQLRQENAELRERAAK